MNDSSQHENIAWATALESKTFRQSTIYRLRKLRKD